MTPSAKRINPMFILRKLSLTNDHGRFSLQLSSQSGIFDFRARLPLALSAMTGSHECNGIKRRTNSSLLNSGTLVKRPYSK